MYKFTTLEGVSQLDGSSFGLIFNGQDFESVIPGFRTLSVSGRGLISRNVQSLPVPGMDGEILTESKLTPREIAVSYVIDATSSEELRRSYEKMNSLLNVPTAKIKFKDDPLYYYDGTVTQTTEDNEITNSVLGSISFYCPSPFKLKDPVTITGTAPKFELPPDYYGIKGAVSKLLADFTFQATATLPIIKLNNSLGHSIEIGPVISGRTYQLLLSGDRVNVIENGMRKMTLLSITSGVEKFKVQPGITFTLSNGGTLTAKFTEARL